MAKRVRVVVAATLGVATLAVAPAVIPVTVPAAAASTAASTAASAGTGGAGRAAARVAGVAGVAGTAGATSRHSRIVGFGARPDPVVRGARIGVRGLLQLETGHGWKAYRGRKVFVVFRADDGSRWNDVTTVRTDGHGRFDVKVTATRSGDWRAEFDGADGVDGASSVAGHVTVRGAGTR
ncbi:hypothetical protein [Streptosporangium sp. NPDC051022]|uniref:hypothetical protein n=1 Tax=Streptosporangium sp. NPDC051022 TaxID=3155752 RepID=UPI00343EE7CB